MGHKVIAEINNLLNDPDFQSYFTCIGSNFLLMHFPTNLHLMLFPFSHFTSSAAVLIDTPEEIHFLNPCARGIHQLARINCSSYVKSPQRQSVSR